MKDIYQKLHEEIIYTLNKHTEMIVWIARRVLSAKEFSEFIDVFTKKPYKSEVQDLLKQAGELE